MNDDRIRQIIRQEIQARDAHARFQLVPIQRHTHNNVDSPYTFQPVLTFGGYVRSDGNLTKATGGVIASGVFPVGWTVTKNGTGLYQVNHNLGTQQYAVTAIPVDGAQFGTITSKIDDNFIFQGYNISAGAAVAADTNFSFILTLLANTSQTLPSYILIA